MTAEEVLAPWVQSEELDGRMREAQDAIQAGDAALAESLLAAFRDPGRSLLDRGIALETVTAARCKAVEPAALIAIREGLASPLEDLQFAALACAGDLSPQGKEAVTPDAERLLDGGLDVRRAARAFLGRSRAKVTEERAKGGSN